MTHDNAHPHYTDISLLGHVQTLITEMKSSTPSDVSLLFPGPNGVHSYKLTTIAPDLGQDPL